jgi:DNA repair photolyase
MNEPNRPNAIGRGSPINPPNRFARIEHVEDLEHLEHDEEARERLRSVRTEYFSDSSRSIITENDSPDVPGRYTLNPYRGCSHGCAYCMSGDTLILAADGTTPALENLRPGMEIYGTVVQGRYRRFVKTIVLAHWQTSKPAWCIRLADGTELLASPDHRFLTERGWKYVAPAAVGQRPYLTLNNSLLGTGRFVRAPSHSVDYQRGYLTGMIRGDAHLGVYDYGGGRRQHEIMYRFRLALVDQDALQRTAAFLENFSIRTRTFVFQKRSESRAEIQAIRTYSRDSYVQILHTIAWPETAPPLEWRLGYLAGLFDAEGGFNDSLRIFNSDAELLQTAEESLRILDFQFVYDVPKKSVNKVVQSLRIVGGLREYLRFFQTIDNAILRKRNIAGIALKSDADTRIVSIQPLGRLIPMYDVTTGTGDFIANGVVSHNCFARPSHEYLDLSAGLDFETKIFVKERAPELFRDFLVRHDWEPEMIMVSGITDCYQPAERHFQLTRRCLEVALEARQPVGIVTKNALVTRDLDLLTPMAELGVVCVSVSVTSLDQSLVRVMEPRTSSIEARLRTIRELSGAGVPVCALVAPIIPGLNDYEIPKILEAVKDAGAHRAAYVLLRLPLTVAPVFMEWLERTQPEKKSRVESRIRETRGGKLYEAEFGTRMTGRGELAEQIRQTFRLFARKYGLDHKLPPLDTSKFRRPASSSGQGWLF